MSSDNHTDVLLEDINAKFDRIIEVVGTMNDELKRKANQEDIETIKSDVKIIKAAIADTSESLEDHDRRIHKLELQR